MKLGLHRDLALGFSWGLISIVVGAIWWPLSTLLVSYLSLGLVFRFPGVRVANFLVTLAVLAFLRNPILSMLASFGFEIPSIAIIQGLDFFMLALASTCHVFRSLYRGRLSFEMILCSSAVLLVAACALFGWQQENLQSAVYYARMFSYFIFAFFVGQACGERAIAASDWARWSIVYVGWACAAFVVVEILATPFLYELLGAHHYLENKYGVSLASAHDAVTFNTRRILNLPSSVPIHLLRPMGITLHTVSSAYLVALAAALAASRRNWWQAGLMGTLLFCIGAKGPIVVAVLASFGCIVSIPTWGLTVFRLQVAAVIISLLLIGLLTLDVHTISLLSALSEFPTKPVGSGLGIGGSVGPLVEVGVWGWDSRGDSALAALVAMMGIAGWIVLWSFFRVGRSSSPAFSERELSFAPAWMTALLVGIVFQEEGLSPAAVGFVALYLGTHSKVADPTNPPRFSR